MSHEEKVKYMRIACNLCRLGFDEKTIDVLVSLYDLVILKEGNATMMDTARVQAAAESREQQRNAPKPKKKVK